MVPMTSTILVTGIIGTISGGLGRGMVAKLQHGDIAMGAP